MRKALIVLVFSTTAALAADDGAFRYSAPIDVQGSAAFVQLPLPPSAYARSAGGNLQDLRIVDGSGQRVPFAVLAPRAAQSKAVESQTDATLYPLPAQPAANGAWPLPLEIDIQGDRIQIKQRGAGTTSAPLSPSSRSAGWLIDTGERERDAPPPQSLRLQWSGPAEFSVALRMETSDDLRQWRNAGGGQLMALSSPSGALTQPIVVLPSGAGRFVRLVWLDAAQAPAISGAQVVFASTRSVVIDPPSELVFSPSAEPPGKGAIDEASQRALHFDLAGVLPIAQIDLRWDSGTRVVPARLQVRDRTGDAWRELNAAVFYRLERGADVSHSPPIAVQTQARYLRVLPDPRAPALDATGTRLVVQAPLASLVFATQGQGPYRLLAGADKAAPSALPVATLVPSLDEERTRFARATLGEWSEVTAVARAQQAQQQREALRPWLLWAVLLAGVAALALMVWRLASGRKAPAPPGA